MVIFFSMVRKLILQGDCTVFYGYIQKRLQRLKLALSSLNPTSDMKQYFKIIRHCLEIRVDLPPPWWQIFGHLTSKRKMSPVQIDNLSIGYSPPPRISAWLKQPVVYVQVLLDKQGKIMNHVFVEVENETIPGKVLRGEIKLSNGLRQGLTKFLNKRWSK